MTEEIKLSQISSRAVVKYLRQQYSIKISDSFEFWNYTPQDVVEWVKVNFKTKITIAEILKAARL